MLPIKFGNLYSIHPFSNKPIVASSCERWGKVDWVKFTFGETFIILPLILYLPQPWNCQIWAKTKQGDTND